MDRIVHLDVVGFRLNGVWILDPKSFELHPLIFNSVSSSILLGLVPTYFGDWHVNSFVCPELWNFFWHRSRTIQRGLPCFCIRQLLQPLLFLFHLTSGGKCVSLKISPFSAS